MKRRALHTKIWQDDWFGELSPIEKCLFIYFITNPYINLCGVYELSDRVILFETGVSKDQLEKVKEKLKDKILVTNGWVIIKNIEKYDDYKGGKLLTAKENQLKDIPSDIRDVVSAYKNSVGWGIDRVSIPYDTTNSTSTSNSNSNRGIVKGEKIYASINYLRELPKEDVDHFTKELEVTPRQVEEKAMQLLNYCLSHGKQYKNYRAFLTNALHKDFKRRVKTAPVPHIEDPEITEEQRQKNVEKLNEIREQFFRPKTIPVKTI